jgi:RNA polymerase sigma-70 factor (ECF subfamily)
MKRWAPPDLISAALAGEAAAAQDLIRAIWPPCFRLSATLIGDTNLAQDAAQEACIIVHEKIRTLRHAEAFDAWLYRIVLREAARVRRRNAALSPSPYAAGFEHDDTASVDVWRALAELPPVLRDVTVMFYFDDLKSEEIAHILRVPHATVRTRLGRARDRLRGLLQDYDIAPQAVRLEVKNHAI